LKMVDRRVINWIVQNMYCLPAVDMCIDIVMILDVRFGKKALYQVCVFE
jgi:hypothetical protein